MVRPLLTIALLSTTALPAYAHKRQPVLSRSGIASYHPYAGMTCAARGVRRGSILRVRGNGRTITVKVIDSGPYVSGRCVDLSPSAFRALFGSLKKGTGRVSYRVIRNGKGAWTGRI